MTATTGALIRSSESFFAVPLPMFKFVSSIAFLWETLIVNFPGRRLRVVSLRHPCASFFLSSATSLRRTSTSTTRYHIEASIAPAKRGVVSLVR